MVKMCVCLYFQVHRLSDCLSLLEAASCSIGRYDASQVAIGFAGPQMFNLQSFMTTQNPKSSRILVNTKTLTTAAINSYGTSVTIFSAPQCLPFKKIGGDAWDPGGVSDEGLALENLDSFVIPSSTFLYIGVCWQG